MTIAMFINMAHMRLGCQPSICTVHRDIKSALMNLCETSQTENLEKCNITFGVSCKNVENVEPIARCRTHPLMRQHSDKCRL